MLDAHYDFHWATAPGSLQRQLRPIVCHTSTMATPGWSLALPPASHSRSRSAGFDSTPAFHCFNLLRLCRLSTLLVAPTLPPTAPLVLPSPTVAPNIDLCATPYYATHDVYSSNARASSALLRVARRHRPIGTLLTLVTIVHPRRAHQS